MLVSAVPAIAIAASMRRSESSRPSVASDSKMPGETVPPLSGYPQAVLAKTTFSAAGDPGFAALLPAEGEIVVVFHAGG